jgi:hypothetical protein
MDLISKKMSPEPVKEGGKVIYPDDFFKPKG